MSSQNDDPTSQPLPDLQQAEFDSDELARLVRDIAACAQITEIIPKYDASVHVPERPTLSLHDGHQLLLSRAARAVQFRYRYQGSDWWDTVMALPGERFRLVRIQHHFDSPPV